LVFKSGHNFYNDLYLFSNVSKRGLKPKLLSTWVELLKFDSFYLISYFANNRGKPQKSGINFRSKSKQFRALFAPILFAINLRTHAHALFAFSSLQFPVSNRQSLTCFLNHFGCLLSSVFCLRSTVFWGLPLEIWQAWGVSNRIESNLCFAFVFKARFLLNFLSLLRVKVS